MSTDQFAEFASAVVRALPRTMDTAVAQGWILNQDALTKVLAEALLPPEQTERSINQTPYVTPVFDADVPEQYKETLAKYRQLASQEGVPHGDVICYEDVGGFTLKNHAPKVGPCYKDYGYLQDWDFPDEPTRKALVFWVPRVLRDSTSKTKDEQVRFLAETRARLDLPSHHLTGFGKVALLAGLILAHFKATGERIPLDRYWVRTDTCLTGGGRLNLGDFGGTGLDCGPYRGFLGVFALGVEALGA